jgi:hypothetical protein
MMPAISTLWRELEEAPNVPGIVARRFLPDAAVDLFVGIENPGGVRLVFIDISAGALTACSGPWPTCAGFDVTADEVPGDTRSVRVAVRLQAPSYRDVFTSLVADVLTSVGSAQGDRDAVLTLVSRLDRWQRFLARHGVEGLSPLERRGLYGELWFLNEYLMRSCSPVTAIEGWTGPLAKDQDFQLPSCSVEVKASAANPDQRVHISNVRQLDDTGTPGELLLLHVALEERHGQGQTLVELVEQLRSALADHAPRFNDRLVQAGYLDMHSPRYSSDGYVVKGHQFYRVECGFPRIVESDLQPGVGDVAYSIALGACAPFAVPDSCVLPLLLRAK